MDSVQTRAQDISASLLHRRWMLALAPLIAVGGYLLASSLLLKPGFPLDDAWIHQTFARNLARIGEWSFIPGQPSAGSTSPLWSLLLAAGAAVTTRVPYFWTYLLGTLCLLGLAFTGENLFRRLVPGWKSTLPWMGLFLAAEWHLVWAAASGMETAFIALLILAVLYLLSRDNTPAWLLGVLTGAAVWVRPDALTLLGPIWLVQWMQSGHVKIRLFRCFQVLAAFLLLFLPYLFFNHQLSGSWWPNTFYAKQAEYAIYQQVSILTRFIEMLTLPMVGAGALLLPGFFYLAWRGIRQRNWIVVAMLLWWLGYSFLYALRLPVTYQHGRYLMPAMPVYFVLGFAGTVLLVMRYLVGGSTKRLLRRVWLLSIAAVTLVFLWMGGNSYAQDVAVIETEMVTTSRWIAEHTEVDSLFAVHDIGAFGYFSGRNLVDLAGLVSPEVIPFMRNEAQLADYLDTQGVDYLVTFPSWYPQMTAGKEMIFSSGGTFAPLLGNDNMAVYRWKAFSP